MRAVRRMSPAELRAERERVIRLQFRAILRQARESIMGWEPHPGNAAKLIEKWSLRLFTIEKEAAFRLLTREYHDQ